MAQPFNSIWQCNQGNPQLKLFNQELRESCGLKEYILMILVLIACIVFIYQEPIVFGEKLIISDVISQGIIFGVYRDSFIGTLSPITGVFLKEN